MQNKKREDKGCITSYTNCIKYDGPNIPCLGLRQGDYINHIIAALVDRICEVSTPQDLSDISVQCLLDNFTGLQEPLSKTVATFLQLLIDNQCTIKLLIDAINDRIDDLNEPDTLILDLKCLSITDDQGNTSYTVQTALQALINEVCSHRTLIASINGTLVTLQTQINALSSSNYVEPQVASCTYSGTKSLSQAFTFLSADYCTFKPRVGSSSDIATAIGRQPSDLNSIFAGNSNFILNPDSLADTDNNQWLTIKNLLDRIAVIEECACKVDCSDIKLGWQVNDNEDGDGVSLDFGGDYGNAIPALFTDCGSTVTFVDKNKKQKTYVLKLKQNYTSIEYDLSMLDLTGMITVKVCAQLCNGSQQCCKCAEVEHMVLNGTCNVCDVTISGTSGQVAITYSHNAFTTTIYATVGEVVYLPKDAFDITYSTISGDATPDTTCLTIGQTTRVCYEFKWETNGNEEGQSPYEQFMANAFFTGIMLDGVNHPFVGYTSSNLFYGRLAVDMIPIVNSTTSLQQKVIAKCGKTTISGSAFGTINVNLLRVEVPDNLGVPQLLIDNQTPTSGVLKMSIPGVLVTDGTCDCTGYFTSSSSS